MKFNLTLDQRFSSIAMKVYFLALKHFTLILPLSISIYVLFAILSIVVACILLDTNQMNQFSRQVKKKFSNLFQSNPPFIVFT